MDYGGWASPCGYAPMLRITMNGAVVTGATGVPTGVLPLQLTLTPRASGLTFSRVLNNSMAYAHAAGYVALELSTNGREYTSSS